MMKLVLFLAFAFVVSGCASSQTRFVVRGDHRLPYGYDEIQLNDSAFQIGFVANAYTMDETTDRYNLYRAAEVTLSHGGRYFTVPNAFGARTIISNLQADPFTRIFFPASTVRTTLRTIQISQMKPGGDSLYYDAKVIVDNMQPQLDADYKLASEGNFLAGILLVVALIATAAYFVVLHK
jgi:hypothetical protein